MSVRSQRRGTREVALEDFVLGIRRTALEPDEMMSGISFPALKKNQVGTFVKLGLRRAGQAISVVNVAAILGFKVTDTPVGDRKRPNHPRVSSPDHRLREEAQHFLVGKTLDIHVIAEAAGLAMQAAHPIDDIRGSAEYRRDGGSTRRPGSASLRDGTERNDFPSERVMLWGKTDEGSQLKTWKRPVLAAHRSDNQRQRVFGGPRHRENAPRNAARRHRPDGDQGRVRGRKMWGMHRLPGRDGCNGLSCRVARAHHATVVTIEGLQKGEELHPFQAAFLRAGAVQCGYCSPGFIMSGVKTAGRGRPSDAGRDPSGVERQSVPVHRATPGPSRPLSWQPTRKEAVDMWGLWIALVAVAVVVVLVVRLGVPAVRRGISSGEAGGFSRSGKPLNPLSWIEVLPVLIRIRLFVPKAEMGQGTHTGLAQIAAEELEVPWTAGGRSCQHPPGGEQVSRNLRKQVDCQPLRPDAPSRSHDERDAAHRGLGPSRSGAGEAGGTGCRFELVGDSRRVITYSDLVRGIPNGECHGSPWLSRAQISSRSLDGLCHGSMALAR